MDNELQQAEELIGKAEARIARIRARSLAAGKEVAPTLDQEAFKEFLKEPYVLIQKGKHDWYCVVPKFVDFSVGWLEFATKSYNVFMINRYTLWIGDVSQKIREATGLEEPEGEFSLDGNMLNFRKRDKAIAQKYRDKFVNRSTGDTSAKVVAGKEFQLLAALIDDGYLPFVPKPVARADYREPQVKFDVTGKYTFQDDAYKRFLELGAIGVYWMTGAGKSFLTMRVMDSLIGPKCLVVPTITLVDQWKQYFTEHAPRLLQEVEVYTYAAYEKIKNRDWTIVVFDECHRLPANSFSRMATVRTKYRMGLSASPYREDGRTSYIFALTGFPVGMDWKQLMGILGKDYHTVSVHIVATQQGKLAKIQELINPGTKTIIFSDGLELGQRIADKFEIPFINGETKNRLKVANEASVFVASRVMDLGVSIKNLEHIIEADFLFGSRQQEIQRTGRLFHSVESGRHDIIMTQEEFDLYGKRLHALVERGFKINIHN